MSVDRGDGEVKLEWWWLGWEQRMPVRVEQWTPYEPAVQYHLTASYKAMEMEDRESGLVLDLAAFTDPPSPYQVWRQRPVEVTNKNETTLLGHLAIAGYTKDLWDLPKEQLPPSARYGRVIAGFYQVHRTHAPLLEELTRYLTDPRSPTLQLPEPPRRRVVLLVEIERPAFLFSGVDRFRKRKPLPATTEADAGENDSVPPGEAVFQWWWGNPISGWGHWKNYHPHVSARLEQALADNDNFRNCQESVPIDSVRYDLVRISRDRPFNFLDQNLEGGFREPFLPESIVTVDNPIFDEQTRMTNNCFVQFHKGNPRRRRPVRRIRRGEAAGMESSSGEPCGICFSDTGFLTGCEKGHIVCSSCSRMALRVVVGDVTQTENLVCGCLTASDVTALQALAQKADATLQALITTPPTNNEARKEHDMEMAQVRRAFQVTEQQIPADVFVKKVGEWFDMIRRRAVEHLYHACRYPGCGMENWILRTDFDTQYRSQYQHVWVCRQGHRNSVLPSQPEIDEINRNILMHPEHYTERCGADQLALRRFRLCGQCVQEGLLTFSVHESGCKQWPGYGSGHRHCYCFHCTSPWGTAPGQCNHGVRCSDPGIQQVRITVDQSSNEVLEIGYVNAQEYIDWVEERRNDPPPTIFPASGTGHVRGQTRQGQLGMEDRAALRRTIAEGTC